MKLWRDKEEKMCESAENCTKLMGLNDDYVRACELHKQAVADKRSQAEIALLSKRIILLRNEIQRIIHADPMVHRFESSQVPKEMREQYAGY